MLVAWIPLFPAEARAQPKDPLPALPVERPVVLPRGWAMLDAGVEHEADEGDTVRLGARYAPLRRVELGVALPLDWRGDGFGPGDADLAARFRLHRSEPPNRSLALEVSVRTPTSGVGAPVPALGLLGGAQAGPFLGTARVAAVGLRDAVVVEPSLLLQVGPAFPFARASIELEPDAPDLVELDAVGGLGVQLNRALAVRGWLGAGLAGLSLEVGA